MSKKDEKVKSIELPTRAVSMELLKKAYIAEGLTEEQISEKYYFPLDQVKSIVAENKLPELRNAYIREGLSKIQNAQLDQAEKLMNMELQYKRLRIVQLQNQLEDYMAYYAKHGDFYKRHPVSGDVLKNSDGIPMQLNVPNVTREINQIKESVTLSEGLKKILSQIDDIINPPLPGVDEDDVIDMDNIDGLFKKNV